MTHLTSSAIVAVNSRMPAVSVLEIDLPDGTSYNAAAFGAKSSTKTYGPWVKKWSKITYGSSDNNGRIARVKATVTVIDDPVKRTLTKVIEGAEGRNWRGSVASIKAMIPNQGLLESDWWYRLQGEVYYHEVVEPFVYKIYLRSTTDEPLRGAGSQHYVTETDFPTAPDESLGQPIPIVMGVFTSPGTVAGMLPCIRVSTNGDPRFGPTTNPFRYLYCANWISDIQNVWDNGAGKTAVSDPGSGTTTWYQESRNGRRYTTIGFNSDPGADHVITADGYGLDRTVHAPGAAANSDLINKNAAEQLRMWLAQFVLRDGINSPPDILVGTWPDFYAVALHRESWDATIAYFNVKEMWGGISIYTNKSVDYYLKQFAETWGVHYFLTEEGELGITINDPHTSKGDIYPNLVFDRRDMNQQFKVKPETTRMVSSVRYQFFHAEADGEYLKSGMAHDPNRTVKREIAISQPWSATAELL
jgi:hypothetical protein